MTFSEPSHTREAAGKDQPREEGAALIGVVILIAVASVLLIALLRTTSSGFTTAVDETSQLQADEAAKAGISAAVDVIRGNVEPPSLVDSYDRGEVDFDTITRLSRSNRVDDWNRCYTDEETGDDVCPAGTRLSRYLPYFPDTSTFWDRVPLVPDYSLTSGSAYSVKVIQTPSEENLFYDPAYQASYRSLVSIDGQPPASTASVGGIKIDCRNFDGAENLSGQGQNHRCKATFDPNYAFDYTGHSFELFYTMLHPLAALKGQTLRFSGEFSGSAPSGTVRLYFDPTPSPYDTPPGFVGFAIAARRVISSSSYKGAMSVGIPGLTDNGADRPYQQLLGELPGYPGRRFSPRVDLTTAYTVVTPIPRRVLLQSTGYGPRGARKIYEAALQRAPLSSRIDAVVLMRSEESGDSMSLNLGDSSASRFLGTDVDPPIGRPVLPFVGVLNDTDAGVAQNAINESTAQFDLGGEPRVRRFAADAIHPWLRTTAVARQMTEEMRLQAEAMSRLFAGYTGVAGTTAKPEYTFVVGDAEITGGAGILMATGEITLRAGAEFRGLLISLGSGSITVEGGSASQTKLLGAIVCARLSPTNPDRFAAPKLNITSGTAGVVMQYDSQSLLHAFNTLGFRVAGVRSV